MSGMDCIITCGCTYPSFDFDAGCQFSRLQVSNSATVLALRKVEIQDMNGLTITAKVSMLERDAEKLRRSIRNCAVNRKADRKRRAHYWGRVAMNLSRRIKVAVA